MSNHIIIKGNNEDLVKFIDDMDLEDFVESSEMFRNNECEYVITKTNLTDYMIKKSDLNNRNIQII